MKTGFRGDIFVYDIRYLQRLITTLEGLKVYRATDVVVRA